MNTVNSKKNNNERIIVTLVITIIGALTAIDVIEDFLDGKKLEHLGLDLAVAFASFFLVGYVLNRYRSEQQKLLLSHKEKRVLEDITSNLRKDLAHQSKILVSGLGTMIDQEFVNWSLTNAEREVAMFLLKGLSAAEMADIRGSSEKTIRHHITSIYKKANLKGRQELQAYFLEDLLSSGPGIA